MIESYQPGKIVVRGKEHTSDVIVYADHVDHTWQRRQSDYLADYDIQDVMADPPQVLIVGTGAERVLKVSPQLKQAMRDSGVELVVAPTEEACRAYNRYSLHKKTTACLCVTG